MLDEKAWELAEVATNFFMITPMDTSYAQVQTDVRMTYDEQNLYIIVVNHHLMEGPYMVESLRRDFSFGKNDNFEEISDNTTLPSDLQTGNTFYIQKFRTGMLMDDEENRIKCEINQMHPNKRIKKIV